MRNLGILFIFYLFPALLCVDAYLSQNISQRAGKKPSIQNPFPAHLAKKTRVVYDNGNSDYTFGFDFVVAPEGAKVATIYDDFVVERGDHLVIETFQTLVASDPAKPMCSQYKPTFQILHDHPNGKVQPVKGPFTLSIDKYPTSVEQYVGDIYYLTIKFARTNLVIGHYWFKFTCQCSEREANVFALATSAVRNNEAWIAMPDYFGPISSSPMYVPPHDFAFAFLLTD